MQKKNSFRGQGSRPNNNNFRGGRRPAGGSRGPKKQNIHPSKFINRAIDRPPTVDYVATNKFSDFALNTRLQENLAVIDFDAPSAIQDQAIPIALQGRDVIGE